MKQPGRCVGENTASHGLTLRNELAAEIGAGSATVKVANETLGALAG